MNPSAQSAGQPAAHASQGNQFPTPPSRDAVLLLQQASTLACSASIALGDALVGEREVSPMQATRLLGQQDGWRVDQVLAHRGGITVCGTPAERVMCEPALRRTIQRLQQAQNAREQQA